VDSVGQGTRERGQATPDGIPGSVAEVRDGNRVWSAAAGVEEGGTRRPSPDGTRQATLALSSDTDITRNEKAAGDAVTFMGAALCGR
jgi:hypothetical protein